MNKPSGYWTRERCYEAAKECISRTDFFKKHRQAYRNSLNEEWMDDYTWFTNKKKPNGYWTYDKCREEAMKYNSIGEFAKGNPSAYNVSLSNNWLDDWFVRKTDPYRSNVDNVYGYFFNEQNTVYIGRTIHPNERHRQHNTMGCVFNFAKENKIEIPEMVILESNLSLEDGLRYEDMYVENYRANGWNILNTGKTGVNSGSLGLIAKDKWTKRKSYEASLECETITEFQKKYPRAYVFAVKNDLLDVWFVRKCKQNGYWDYKRCFEEAKKYTTRTQFARKSPSAYKSARQHKWLEDYTWFEEILKPRGFYTYEVCAEIAKKYTRKNDFKKENSRAYTLSRKNGWLDEFFPQIKKAAC